jgi:hypothetical protein
MHHFQITPLIDDVVLPLACDFNANVGGNLKNLSWINHVRVANLGLIRLEDINIIEAIA